METVKWYQLVSMHSLSKSIAWKARNWFLKHHDMLWPSDFYSTLTSRLANCFQKIKEIMYFQLPGMTKYPSEKKGNNHEDIYPSQWITQWFQQLYGNFEQIKSHSIVEIFIVMSNKLEKLRNVSIWWRNKQFCDQNARTLLAYQTSNIASLIPKFIPSDTYMILCYHLIIICSKFPYNCWNIE